MRKLRTLFVVAWISGSCIAAFGQSYRNFQDELTEVRDLFKLKFGPFRVLPALRLSSLGFDDNVYYRTAEKKPVGDYTGTASPEIKVYLLAGRSLILSLADNPEYLYYVKEDRLRTFTNSFVPGARLRLFNRFVLSGEYHFQKHTRRAFSEFSRLVTDTVKGTTAGFFYETPRGTSIGFSGTIDRFLYEDIVLPDYEARLSRSLNRKEKTGNFELYYRVFSGSYFFTKVGSTTYEFEHPSSRWRNSRSFQMSSGIRFPFMGRARGMLSLGYKKFMPEAAGRKRFSGLIADTNLDFRFGRIGLRFGLGRGNHFSYFEDAFYYIENKWNVGLSFYLTRLLRIDYDLQYGELKYPEPFKIPGSVQPFLEISRTDVHRTHSVGVTIAIIRNTGIQLSYNIFDRTSNAPGFNIKRNFIGISLTQDF
jgi:hypothetical protein